MTYFLRTLLNVNVTTVDYYLKMFIIHMYMSMINFLCLYAKIVSIVVSSFLDSHC